jgi:hypothetical protein
LFYLGSLQFHGTIGTPLWILWFQFLKLPSWKANPELPAPTRDLGGTASPSGHCGVRSRSRPSDQALRVLAARLVPDTKLARKTPQSKLAMRGFGVNQHPKPLGCCKFCTWHEIDAVVSLVCSVNAGTPDLLLIIERINFVPGTNLRSRVDTGKGGNASAFQGLP